MKNENSETQETFTVEQGFSICLCFFDELGPLLVSKIPVNKESQIIYELFFEEVCSGFYANDEWVDAIIRAGKIPDKNQQPPKLSEKELFLTAIEFVKIHNERWEGGLDYLMQLLESMQERPKSYQKEWKIWEATKSKIISGRCYKSSVNPFDFSSTRERGI